MEQTLGKRISSQRKKLKLTQDQLAEKLGVTAQAVSKWEHDQSCPDITTLPRLAEIFGITTDELLGIEPAQKVHEAELITKEDDRTERNGLHISKGGLEFKLDNDTPKGSIGIAVLVLAVGGLTLLSELLNWGVSFWSILWPTTLLVFGLFGVMPKFSFFRLGCLVFGGYFLLENLNILPFDLGWSLVLPVILLLFGISLLVDAVRKNKKPHININLNSQNEKSYQLNCSTNGEELNYSASFSEDHRTVSMARLSHGTINTSFGDYTVDLSEVEEFSSDCLLEINSSFGDLELLVPSCYQVCCEHHTSFGDVEIKGHPAAEPRAIIRVTASISFGELTVRYI